MAKVVKSITIDKEVIKKSEIVCYETNRSFSNYIEMLIKEDLKKRGK